MPDSVCKADVNDMPRRLRTGVTMFRVFVGADRVVTVCCRCPERMSERNARANAYEFSALRRQLLGRILLVLKRFCWYLSDVQMTNVGMRMKFEAQIIRCRQYREAAIKKTGPIC